MSIWDWIIWIVALLVFGLFGWLLLAPQQTTGPTRFQAERPEVFTERRLEMPQNANPHIIESVEVQTADGQVVLSVRGYQPDGCREPVHVDQTRVGNEIYVQIYRILAPGQICTRVALPYNEDIPIDIPLTRGETYTFYVNDVTATANP